MSDLARFREAQDAPHAGFTVALRELQAGRKTGHWIWYVFPQLAGLGRSSTAVYYGLAGAAEAADYLRDRVLGERLVVEQLNAWFTTPKIQLPEGTVWVGDEPFTLLRLMDELEPSEIPIA
jgi:uncharacterized protein (DUF1810 family)